MKYYGIDASVVSATGTKASTPPPTPNGRTETASRKNRYEMIQKQNEIISSTQFGRYRAKNAIIIRLVYE